jgi:hypothetical protein
VLTRTRDRLGVASDRVPHESRRHEEGEEEHPDGGLVHGRLAIVVRRAAHRCSSSSASFRGSLVVHVVDPQSGQRGGLPAITTP